MSDLTDKECNQFFDKGVDIVTPNGFEDSFVPSPEVFEKKRKDSRNKIIDAVSALLNQQLSKDSMLIINSGRL